MDDQPDTKKIKITEGTEGNVDTPTGAATPAKVFTVKLFQSHIARSHTETFQIEADNIEEARKKADEMIATDKEIPEGDDYDLEVEEITAPQQPLQDVAFKPASAEEIPPEAVNETLNPEDDESLAQ